MFGGIPQDQLQIIAVAFALGWVIAMLVGFLARKFRVPKRDARDDRIRALEAEQRITKSTSENQLVAKESLQSKLRELEGTANMRKTAFDHQFQENSKLRKDLKDSVLKTRELRAELSNRAIESVKSEVKLREVETELEVSRASSAMLATGMLDYTEKPDGEEDEDTDIFKTVK